MIKSINKMMVLVAAVSFLGLVACDVVKPGDDISNSDIPNSVYIAPATKSITEGVSIADSPTSVIISAALYEPVENTITVSIDHNSELVGTYNESNDTDYTELPGEALSFSSKSLSIPNGEIVSGDSIEVSIDPQSLNEEVVYLLPLEIKEVNGGNIGMSNIFNVKYYVLN